MALLDTISDAIQKILPPKRQNTIPMPPPVSSGLKGAGRGIGQFEDEMIVSKPAIVFSSLQAFFIFIAMCCFAGIASFQSHWHVGPSGLTGFAIFVTLLLFFLSLFMVTVPVISEKYDKFNRLARAIKEVRVGFILAGTGVTLSFLMAFIVTISAWTEPGCKDADKDPNADKGDDFKKGLDGFCTTKKAGAIFLWFAFAFWFATLVLAVLDWRSGKSSRHRDPAFVPPTQSMDEGEEDDGTSTIDGSYKEVPARQMSAHDDEEAQNSPFADSNARTSAYSTAYTPATAASPTGYSPQVAAPPRTSIDAYGAFNDPVPSGYGSGSASPGVSRTMQYADPYAAIRNTIGGSSASPASGPPSYEYTGYR